METVSPREFLKQYKNALTRQLAAVGKSATGKEWDVSMDVLDDFVQNMENNKLALVHHEGPTDAPHRDQFKGVVRYWELGRNKVSGTFNVNEGGPMAADNVNAKMLREFSKHLMSSDISFNNGIIFAGVRPVGKYEAIFEQVNA